MILLVVQRMDTNQWNELPQTDDIIETVGTSTKNPFDTELLMKDFHI